MQNTNKPDKCNNSDFSDGDRWIFFSVILVVSPVFIPYIFDFLQGKTINMRPDALDISLLVYSVSCSLFYLCFECPSIKKYIRKTNKIISFIFAIFSIVFYIHSKSSKKTPDNIDTFIYIGLFVIFYTIIAGHKMSDLENKNGK